VNLARRALIVVFSAVSTVGVSAAGAAPTGPAQVTVTQTAGSLQAGTVNTVTAVVRDASGAVVPDGTLVSFTRLGSPTMAMPFGRTIHVLLNDDTILTADVFLYSVGPGTRRRRNDQLEQLRAWLAAG
jgi:hypothetical protein